MNAAEISGILQAKIRNIAPIEQLEEVGRVVKVADGVAIAYGLNNVQSGEMVVFSSGVKGMVLNLEEDSVGIVIFG
jgi:F-type H+-transporting ATPase subunit alpha